MAMKGFVVGRTEEMSYGSVKLHDADLLNFYLR